MSLLAPANAVAGMMPGGGLLPTPNPLATVSLKLFSINVYLLNSLFMAVLNICATSDGRDAVWRPWSSKYGADCCHGNTGTQHEPPGGHQLLLTFSVC